MAVSRGDLHRLIDDLPDNSVTVLAAVLSAVADAARVRMVEQRRFGSGRRRPPRWVARDASTGRFVALSTAAVAPHVMFDANLLTAVRMLIGDDERLTTALSHLLDQPAPPSERLDIPRGIRLSWEPSPTSHDEGRPPEQPRDAEGSLLQLLSARARRYEEIFGAEQRRTSALEALGSYVGARPGLTSELVAHPPDPDADPFGAALVDDQQREIAGLGKREWRGLDAKQKAAAVAAGAARWR